MMTHDTWGLDIPPDKIEEARYTRNQEFTGQSTHKIGSLLYTSHDMIEMMG
jgi:hypothetical protein